MSQGNVELVRRSIDAFNQRDRGSYLALMDDNVEAIPRGARMEGSYLGHDGIRACGTTCSRSGRTSPCRLSKYATLET
jgi:hypothetical protein